MFCKKDNKKHNVDVQGQKCFNTRTLHLCIFYIFSHSGINLILQYPLLFWEGFAQDFGSLLKGLALIYPPECYQGQLLMFGDKVWLTGGVPDHPKGVISSQNRGKHFFMDHCFVQWRITEKDSKLLPQRKSLPISSLSSV